MYSVKIFFLKSKGLPIICFFILKFINGYSQQNTPFNKEQKLLRLSVKLNVKNRSSYKNAIDIALKKNWQSVDELSHSKVLIGIDPIGFPVYFKTFDNVISAATTNTNAVQPGGELELNLTGSSPWLANKLAIWDEGIVFSKHVEFLGKTITIGDDAARVLDHATHVAGTIIASGKNSLAKGMAFGITSLLSFDFNNESAEMASEAAKGLLLSNHSYGYDAGWTFSETQHRWEWVGLPGDTLDYKFGFYGNEAKTYDEIAFYAPNYLIVQAAGNSHTDTGPSIGGTYYGYLSKTDQTLVNKGPRPENISSNKGYDVISLSANAKNILTIGAVYPLPTGPSTISSVSIAEFSSWGPTDDGRIKPDICGNGVNVLSTGSSSPNDYYKSSGTSTATANVTGSLLLLQEYYSQKNSKRFMRAATLKGLVSHTAFDAGNIGPDYIYGWGLLDINKAAQTITTNGTKSLIQEKTLLDKQIQIVKVVATNNKPLIATISWTDPEGLPSVYGTINDRSPKLVNDLDIRIIDENNVFYPWVLQPDNPAANAIQGDNFRDNVEQVLIRQPIAGQTYIIEISHKKRLLYGVQNYSLIVTGIDDIRADTPLVNNNELVTVYPIPSGSLLNVVVNSSDESSFSISLYNTSGVKVYQQIGKKTRGAEIKTLNLSELPNGIYFMRIGVGKKVYYRKVSILH
jgi:hypothetical protein